MQNFEFYCQKVGYDRNAEYPKKKFRYYAYKDGKVSDHATLEEAKAAGTMTEKYCVNQAEYDLQVQGRRELEARAVEMWHKALRDEHAALPEVIYQKCYSRAYDRGHAYGYDEVALHMDDEVEFAEDILKVVKELGL